MSGADIDAPIKAQVTQTPAYWNRGLKVSKFIPLPADYKPKTGRIHNLTGQRFGRLVALHIIGKHDYKGRGCMVWRCQCDCGESSDVTAHSLRDGSTRSCGCLYMGGRAGVDPPNKLQIGQSALNQFFGSYNKSARIRGHKFTLSKYDFGELTRSNCHYCGAAPSLKFRAVKGTNGDYIGNGIDRLNNDKGYIDNNVVPCCKQCNIAKNTMAMAEFSSWILKVSDWAKSFASLGNEPFNLSDREMGEEG